jgi:ribonuclease VapC
MATAGVAAVFDASALLALLYDEHGADRVERSLQHGGLVSAVNWAETLSDMTERGESADVAGQRARIALGAIGSLTIVPFDDEQAMHAARLRPVTRSLGLSLADRACLALGRLNRLPVLTTDRAWRSLHLSIKIEVIR